MPLYDPWLFLYTWHIKEIDIQIGKDFAAAFDGIYNIYCTISWSSSISFLNPLYLEFLSAIRTNPKIC